MSRAQRTQVSPPVPHSSLKPLHSVSSRLAKPVAHWCFLVTLAACADSPAATDAAQADQAPIVGDVIADAEHPEVVALDVVKDGATFVCTATLIGAHTLLTARHCIEGAVDTAGCHITALVDRDGTSSVSPTVERYEASACVHMDPTRTYRSDLGMIRLSRDIVGVTPARLATTTTERGLYTVYGYGSFGQGQGVGCEKHSDGHKRKAQYSGRLGVRFGQVTCKGDSGGPHFAGDSNVLAGVTSGGAALGGLTLDFNVDVADTRAWIDATLVSFDDALR